MRLLSISLRGRVDAFLSDKPVEIDFDALGAGVVALCGINGSGKTSLLESPPTSLYKTFPSRPGWYEGWSGRDAFVETVWADGDDEIRVRVQVDAERRTTEAYIFINGVSVTTGRAAEFEAEIERRFGSLALFLSSVFSAQNKAGSFLLKKKGDRKALFVELLGIGSLQVLHEAARSHVADTEHDVNHARQKVADVEAETADLPTCEAGLTEAQQAADAAAGQLDTARTEEAAALAVLERAKGAAERLTALESAEAAASRELEAAEKALTDARALGPKAEADAKEQLRRLDNRKAGELEGKAHARHETAMQRLTGRREQLEAALVGVSTTQEAGAAVQAAETAIADIAARDRLVDEARAESREAISALRLAEERLKSATEARKERIERLERQAGLLPQVPCTASSEWEAARHSPDGRDTFEVDLAGACPLLADARQAQADLEKERAVIMLPEDAAVVAAREAADRKYERLQALPPSPDSTTREALKKAEQMARAALARAEAAATARKQLSDLAVEVDEELQRHTGELAEAAEKVLEAGRERAQIESELADALFVAEEKVKGAEQVRQAAFAGRSTALDVLVKEKRAGIDPARAAADASTRTQDRKAGEELLRQADTALARCRAQVEALQAKAATLPALRDTVTAAERELGDWSLLAKAAGPDGAQALEIDAAGPQVSSIANELLAVYPGESFSIAFDTLREKKSARGEFVEAFEVKCFHNGREKAVEMLSGGQAVVIGEAIGLSIAIYNSRKSGVRYETLWRDETAGALDPAAAIAYVLMLRRARELGGFAQVLFIAHQPEVQEAADVRLVVAGGRVSVESERRAA